MTFDEKSDLGEELSLQLLTDLGSDVERNPDPFGWWDIRVKDGSCFFQVKTGTLWWAERAFTITRSDNHRELEQLRNALRADRLLFVHLSPEIIKIYEWKGDKTALTFKRNSLGKDQALFFLRDMVLLRTLVLIGSRWVIVK